MLDWSNTAHAMQEARQRLGLSAARLAEVIGLGANGGRTVRRWEAGDFEPTGPVRVVLNLLVDRLDAGDYATLARFGVKTK